MTTPSQDIITAARRETSKDFGEGRSVTIRRLLPLDRMKLAEIVGGENVKNDLYFGYASLAYHVMSLDGHPVPRPSSKRELEVIVQRLGDDGLNAIGDILRPEVEGDSNPEEAKGAVKN